MSKEQSPDKMLIFDEVSVTEEYKDCVPVDNIHYISAPYPSGNFFDLVKREPGPDE